MSVIATALKHLIAAGVSGDALVRAVAEIEAAGASEKPRSPAAVRQAQYRERRLAMKEAGVEPGDVTSDVTDVTLRNEHNTRNGARPVRSIAHQAALEMWNEMAGRNGLAKALTATGKRQAMLRQRLAEHGEDAFRKAVEAVERSPFCLGKNERGWKADIGFLLRPDNFVKLLEGGYGPIETPKAQKRPPSIAELRKMLAYAEDQGDWNWAEELKAKLAAATSTDPVAAKAIEQASRQLRAVSQ